MDPQLVQHYTFGVVSYSSEPLERYRTQTVLVRPTHRQMGLVILLKSQNKQRRLKLYRLPLFSL
jgi:hypothetical protein